MNVSRRCLRSVGSLATRRLVQGKYPAKLGKSFPLCFLDVGGVDHAFRTRVGAGHGWANCWTLRAGIWISVTLNRDIKWRDAVIVVKDGDHFAVAPSLFEIQAGHRLQEPAVTPPSRKKP
jgi:hypothetical protein